MYYLMKMKTIMVLLFGNFLGVSIAAGGPSLRGDSRHLQSAHKVYCNSIECPDHMVPVSEAWITPCGDVCTEAKCCLAHCSSFPCPDSFSSVPQAATMLCENQVCTQEQCCEALCSGYACPDHYIPTDGARDMLCHEHVCTTAQCCDLLYEDGDQSSPAPEPQSVMAEPAAEPSTIVAEPFVEPMLRPIGERETTSPSQPELRLTADPTSAPQAELEPTPIPQQDPAPMPLPQSQLGQNSEPQSQVEPITFPQSSSGSTPTPQPQLQPQSHPEPTLTPQPESTLAPEAKPTLAPQPELTAEPISTAAEATTRPTAKPTKKIALEPTPEPTQEPTPEPTLEPTQEPTPEPTPEPIQKPTPEPTSEPTPYPTSKPIPEPTPEPSPGTEISSGEDSYGPEYEGEGTYYGFTTDGNCAIRDNIPSIYDGMTPVAIGGPLYAESRLCGACIEGSGNGVGSGSVPIEGPFKAYVSDQCPECAESDLDFAQDGDGRWEIEWHFVECAGGGPPEFVFEGSNPFYWKIQPRGTASPVERLAVNGMDLTRTNDNFFEIVVGSAFEGEQTVEVWTITGEYYSTGVSL